MKPKAWRQFVPGSARVSRAGDRVLAIANFSRFPTAIDNEFQRKECFGETPKPARETRALPRMSMRDLS
jgi:hypothetical protein